MDTLKHLIAKTKLLSDHQKVAILSDLDTYTPQDREALTKTLETFAAQYQQLVAQYQALITKELAGIMADEGGDQGVRQAVDQMRTGLHVLTE